MTAFARTSRGRAALVVFAIFAGVGFLPLFGGPGYEHALASGLIVPGAAAILTSLELSGRAPLRPVLALARGVANGALLAGVSFATALLHGLRVGFCDLWGGLVGFVLTAFVGALLGGAWGAYVAERARGKKRARLLCVVLSLAAPLLGVGVSLWRFYSSPMIFAFDPFVGYFSGTLYDTVVDAGAPLLTYRLGSLATLLGAFALASILDRDDQGRLRVSFAGPLFAARVVLVATGFGASLAVTLLGPSLGHYETKETIAKELGGRRSGARCDVVYPDGLRDDEVRLLVKDCDEEIENAERVLDIHGPDRITAFFFRDAGEKKRLMGAGDTYIAKPWRKEVYLQVAGYPHPVLGHEIAHAVSGTFGRGPFRIAGELGGLLPNPGLIEGLATAVSPDADELSDATWSRAMLDLGILPPLADLFSLDFLGRSHAVSYTVAGAAIRWLMDTVGVAKVRALYAGAPPEVALGKSWSALDDDFRAYLKTLPMPAEAEGYAKAKFDKPGVFGRKCPHVIDAWLREANACRDGMQIDRAVVLYDRVLARDPHDYSARYGRALANLRFGEAARGRREMSELDEDRATPRTWKDRAEEALADADWLEGATDSAVARYKALAERSLDEDAARRFEVKGMGALDPRARIAVGTMLVGTPRRQPDPWLSTLALGAWSEATHDPLAAYLIGHNLGQHGFYEEAAPYLDKVLADGAPTARVHRETLRDLAILACAEGSAARVRRVREALRAPGSPFASGQGGRLEDIERLLNRCQAHD